MKHFFFFSLLFVMLAALVLAGCSSKEKCAVDSDCTASGAYNVPVCVDHQCYTKTVKDYCGNNVCEDGEDACSCSADCTAPTRTGRCSGKLTYTPNPDRPTRMINATYASYYCNEDDRCVVGALPRDTTNKTLFAQANSYLDFDFTFTITQPFTIGNGDFLFTAKLTDYNQDRVTPPFKITSIKVLSGNELIGQQELNATFDAVGDAFAAPVTITPHLDLLEDEIPITMQIDYTYNGIIGDGLRIERDSYTKQFNDLFFIDPERAS